jgi:DNA anti-recombination protein RmuC
MYRMDWTDGRLQERFDSIDRRFNEVDRRFEQVDKRFDKVDADIREMRSEMSTRFDGLQRTMIQGVIALAGAFIAGFAALIVLIATQL